MKPRQDHLPNGSKKDTSTFGADSILPPKGESASAHSSSSGSSNSGNGSSDNDQLKIQMPKMAPSDPDEQGSPKQFDASKLSLNTSMPYSVAANPTFTDLADAINLAIAQGYTPTLESSGSGFSVAGMPPSPGANRRGWSGSPYHNKQQRGATNVMLSPMSLPMQYKQQFLGAPAGGGEGGSVISAPVAPSSTSSKDELAKYVFPPGVQSRAMMIFHSPMLLTSIIRNACSHFGALKYFLPEYHSRGVTFIAYFDINDAINAHSALIQKLVEGFAAAEETNSSTRPSESPKSKILTSYSSSSSFNLGNTSSVCYSYMLYSNGFDESKIVLQNVPVSASITTIENSLRYFGSIRFLAPAEDSAKHSSSNGSGDGKSSEFVLDATQAYIAEYLNMQHANLALIELNATNKIGMVPIHHALSVVFPLLPPNALAESNSLTAKLTKWRNELAAPSSPAATNLPITPFPFFDANLHMSLPLPGSNNAQLSYAYSPLFYAPNSSNSVLGFNILNSSNPNSKNAGSPNTSSSSNTSPGAVLSYSAVPNSSAMQLYSNTDYSSNSAGAARQATTNLQQASPQQANPYVNYQSYMHNPDNMHPNPNYNMYMYSPYPAEYPPNPYQTTVGGPPEYSYYAPHGQAHHHQHNHGGGGGTGGGGGSQGYNNTMVAGRGHNQRQQQQGYGNNQGRGGRGNNGGNHNSNNHNSNNYRNQNNDGNYSNHSNHSHGQNNFKKSAPPIDSFEVDVRNLESNKESRTTVMVRNIPNKYHQKMLLDEVNVHVAGSYDFFYLPIDFNNNCNMGYAFINFLTPQGVANFIRHFDGKKWKKFISEKVCAVTFARIQGKSNLVTRFQNSSLLSRDDHCRPLLFYSSGPSIGKAEPFPSPTPMLTFSPSDLSGGGGDVGDNDI